MNQTSDRVLGWCPRTALLVRFWDNAAWAEKSPHHLRRGRADALWRSCSRLPIPPADWFEQSARLVCVVSAAQQSLPNQRDRAGRALSGHPRDGTIGLHGVPSTQRRVPVLDGAAWISGRHQPAPLSPALQSCWTGGLSQTAQPVS